MANYFKDNLKFIREKKGLSKNRLGELTGVNQTTIGRWENGEITPTIDNVIDVMDALNIPISYLGNFLGQDMKLNKEEIINIDNDNPSIKNDSEQLKQFRLLYDKMKDLPEESQRMICNVTKSVMDEIDNQLDNKE